MLGQYHRRTLAAAESAVATGRPSSIYWSMVRSAAIWTIPAILAVFICSHMGFGGLPLLYVCLPLVMLSIIGACGYVGWIYWRAMMRRTR